MSTLEPAHASASADDGAMELGGPGEPLPAGRYTRTGFEPPITFELDAGWTAEQTATGFFDVQRGAGTLDVIAVQFARVLDAASAAEAAATIEGNPQLSVVSGPAPVSIGGFDGIQIVVDTADPPDTQPVVFRQVLSVAAGPLSIASGRRLQVTLIETHGGLVGVLVGGSIRRWDAAIEAAAPVLASVTIGE